MVSTIEVALIVEQVGEYESLIKEAYMSDADFVATYHEEAGTGIENCLRRTMTDFKKANNFRFFKLSDVQDNYVGYFGEADDGISENKYLCGFFILPEHRNFKTKNIFWEAVRNHFNDEFFCGVSSVNYKAVNFCFFGGGVIKYTMDYNKEKWYYFHFKN